MSASGSRQHAAFCALLLMIVGCSQNDVVQVTGIVSWEGSPLQTGEIRFLPLDPTQSPAGAPIRDGKYTTFAKVGMARVEIQAARLSGKLDRFDKKPLSECFIPDRYNVKSSLTADITSDRRNEFNFDLTR